MVNHKKAQTDLVAVLMTLIVAGLLAIFGVVVYSQVSNSANDLFSNTLTKTSNESVTITSQSLTANSSTLAEDGYIVDSERVVNGSTGAEDILTRNVDYRIVIFDGLSGELQTQANFTLINSSIVANNVTGYNGTALRVSYNHNEKSAARLSKESLDSSVLDSIDLGVIALIILAAVVIIGSLFYITSK